jgi:hypothetical protein
MQFGFMHGSHTVYNSLLSDAAEVTRTKTIVSVREFTTIQFVRKEILTVVIKEVIVF